MKRIKKNALSVLTFAVIIFFFAFLYGKAAHNPMDDVEWERSVHVVESGETMWDIAKIYCPKKVDIRAWIYEVEKMNGIQGYIYAGDEIVVLEAK